MSPDPRLGDNISLPALAANRSNVNLTGGHEDNSYRRPEAKSNASKAMERLQGMKLTQG